MKFSKRNLDDSGPSNYLKLKSGDSVIGVFRGEAYSFWTRWESGKSYASTAGDAGAKERFKMNIVVKEGEAMVAKTWEFSPTVYNQLALVNEEYPLETTKVKITRHGEKLDTTYSIMPTKDQLSPGQLKSVEAVPLNLLQGKITKKEETFATFDDGAPLKDYDGPAFDSDQVPF